MSKRKKPDAYEQAQWQAIERWRSAPPDWGTKVMAGPSRVAAYAAQHLVPVGVLRTVLRGVDHAAGWTSARQDVMKAAGVDDLAELREVPLQECDRLSRRVELRAMALGGVGGALFGFGGAPGMAADIPTLLGVALRTIHRTAYCYGEDWRAGAHKGLAIGVFALASANTLQEKEDAWRALEAPEALFEAAWRDGVERVAERHLAKEAAQFSMKTLAGRIGMNLTRRRAFGFGLMPVIGAAIGCAVNAGYIHDVATVARYVMQHRWLGARYPRLAVAAVDPESR
ncbi:EcsC family protein [Solimonas soli]|uniref:EcsC family protein n=1 Tax=Solimonas soli TaxID=413479 RepID=UPI000484A394|nr:EcsC family protein [Solimonas soli]